MSEITAVEGARVNGSSQPGTASGRRRVGRPRLENSESLDRHVLETATRLFIDKGYAGTSMEQIASAGRVGKQTIYRRYPTKAALFNAVVTDSAASLFETVHEAEKAFDDPLMALRHVCRTLLDLSTDPDTIATYRVLVADAWRFPALSCHAREMVMNSFYGEVSRLLGAIRDDGRIRWHGDTAVLSRFLLGLFTNWLFQQTLLGGSPLPTDEERDAFFAQAWGLAFDGLDVRGAE
jgi:AcrR family transcriptional regulator